MFFMVLIAFLAVAFTRMLPGELRSATREHVTTQGRYVTEAGIQEIMYRMQAAPSPTPYPAPSQGQTGSLPGGWTWEITEPVTLVNDHYWITIEAKQNGVTKRRAKAVVFKGTATSDNLLPAWYFPGYGSPNNPHDAWDFDVSCTGDIWIDGTWRMKGFDDAYSGAPKINGNVYASGAYSGSPCGGEYIDDKPYTAGPPPVANPTLYSKIYTTGQSAVRPNSPLPDTGWDANTATLTLQNTTFGSGFLGADPSVATDSNRLVVNYNTATSTNSVANCGIYVNGSPNITLGVADSNGNLISTPAYTTATSTWNNTYAGGNAVTKFNFGSTQVRGPKMAAYDPPTGVKSTEWTMTEAKNGYNFPATGNFTVNGVNYTSRALFTANNVTAGILPSGVSKTIVSDAANKHFFFYDGVPNVANSNGQGGTPIYVSGDITGLQGINKGKKTISSSKDSNVTITGELLKSCRSPGTNGTTEDPDVLGVVKGGYNNTGNCNFSFNIGTNPHSGNNTCYIYAALAGLAKADFEEGGGHGSTLWSNADLWINGSLIQDMSVSGHMKKFFNFFGAYDTTMILDPASPPIWPLQVTNTFLPKLKAFVDIPVYKYQ